MESFVKHVVNVVKIIISAQKLCLSTGQLTWTWQRNAKHIVSLSAAAAAAKMLSETPLLVHCCAPLLGNLHSSSFCVLWLLFRQVNWQRDVVRI